ncbi:hypothetical protein JCM8097_008346 [Rhodosporidiobolus ruineniae]
MSAVDTNGITITWELKKSVREVLALLEGEQLKSGRFDNRRWELHLRRNGDTLGLYLCAILHVGTSKRLLRLPSNAYAMNQPTCGHEDFFKLDTWAEQHPESVNELLSIRCTVAADPFLPTPNLPPSAPPPSKRLLSAFDKFFDSKSASDVCFTFPGTSDVVYANKAFLQARSSYFKTLFKSSPTQSQVDSDDDFSSSSLAPSSLQRPVKRRKVDPVGVSKARWEDDDDPLDWLPQDWLEKHPQEKVEDAVDLLDEVGEQVPGEDDMQKIKVEDATYATYRAMLYYLYTEKIHFLPLASNLVVELYKPKQEQAADDPDDDLPNPSAGLRRSSASITSSSAASTPSRRAWLLSQRTKTTGAAEPVSPHAIFRLADSMDLMDLKKRAREAIEEGFTVDNVLYEFISSFSNHFDEVQDAASKFIYANWDDVSASAAFDRVLEDAGKVDGGVKLLGKLMKGLGPALAERAKKA